MLASFSSSWNDAWDNFDTLFHVIAIFLVALISLFIVRRVMHHFVIRLAKSGEEGVVKKVTTTGELSVLQAQRLETIESLLQSFASLIVWIVAILAIIIELFPKMGPLLAGISVIGTAALGLGAQSFVKDVLAGLFMLVENQYALGDTIDVGEATGTVEDISLRTTRIRSEDGTLWYMPNGEIKKLGNKSQPAP